MVALSCNLYLREIQKILTQINPLVATLLATVPKNQMIGTNGRYTKKNELELKCCSDAKSGSDKRHTASSLIQGGLSPAPRFNLLDEKV